jgi:DNA-binding transcriptional LysR family regulator
MNWNQLQLFDTVARVGSMTAAAEALAISQPAVSKQVRQLELTLGVKLFDRHARQLQLTKAGQVLAARTRQAFALLAEAEREMSDLSSLQRGTVFFGATPTLGAYALPEVLVHFRRRFPDIDLKLEIGASAHLAALVADGELDAALSDVLLDSARTTSRHFATETLVIIAARGHPLTRRKSVSAAMVSVEPFVTRETTSASRSFAERAMAARGIQVRATLSLASTEAIKRAVAGELGLAVVPERAVVGEVQSKQLGIVRVPQLALRRPLYITTRRGSRDSRAMIAFLYQLKHSLRGTLPKLRRVNG